MMSYCDTAEDCEWLADVHLSKLGTVPAFRAYIIEGNEDAPERITLYAQACPMVTDGPIAVYTMDPETGELSKGK